MIRNFIKSNLRALWKNRSQTIVNLIGLSLGMSSAIIIFLVIHFEFSFDIYHQNAGNIYRVVSVKQRFGETSYNSGSTYPLPIAMRQDFPDLEHVTITDSNFSDPVISVPHDDGNVSRFIETKVAYVDPEYFLMFDYEWVHGSRENALSKEKTVVISESIARKYFGTNDVMGRIINFNNQYDLTISGLIQNPPANTDLPFEIIISNRLGADQHGWDDWDSRSSSLNCYVQLKDETNLVDFQKKIEGWHKKYYNDQDDGAANSFFLQPLSEVHFDTRFTNYNDRVVSRQSLMALAFIGLLLLATACINFVNLNTVLITNRSREVGVRKVLGSSRIQLVFQFLGETFSITVLAILLSAGIIELALLRLNPVLGFRLEFRPLTDWVQLLFVLSLPLLVSILAGLYPAVSLASFQPIAALKKRLAAGFSEGITMRRVLISLQLAISQALVICTLIIMNQMDYFMSQPLGLESDSVIEFEIPENKNIDLARMKERILQIPGITSASYSNTGSTAPDAWGGNFKVPLESEVVEGHAKVKFTDEDYVNTYQLELLEGENLVKSDTVDRFIVNEALVRALGFENNADVVGESATIWGRSAPIRGVVKDFNTSSLHEDIPPVFIMVGARNYVRCAIRFNTSDTRALMNEVRKTWEVFFPKYVFEYQFLDDTIENYYEEERRTSTLLSLFSGVAIIIGCIGLFGLVSFMVTAKTKEIGIRKALGASVAQIVTLFSKEFALLIIISFVIAAPVAYYFMNKWLNNFAYKIEPGMATYLIGFVMVALIVTLTIGSKSYRAAMANPVDALRDE